MKKIKKETIYMIVQSMVLAGLSACFSCWCCVEGNDTIVKFLTGLKQEGVTYPQLLEVGLYFFIIFLIINILISTGIYLIIFSKSEKKKTTNNK